MIQVIPSSSIQMFTNSQIFSSLKQIKSMNNFMRVHFLTCYRINIHTNHWYYYVTIQCIVFADVYIKIIVFMIPELRAVFTKILFAT